jgi:hypothetical protein
MVGASKAELRAMLPDDWVDEPVRKGSGIKFGTPARGSRSFGAHGWAEYHEGVPNSPDELHRGSFVRVSAGGLQYRVAARGNPVIESKGPEFSVQLERNGSPGRGLIDHFRRPYFRLPWRR